MRSRLRLLLIAFVLMPRPGLAADPPPLAIGVNLDAFAYWSSTCPTGNLADQLQPFPGVTFTADGYPTGPSVPSTAILGGEEPMPAGTYRLSAWGQGSIWLSLVYADRPATWFTADFDGTGGARQVEVVAPLSLLQVRIQASDAANPIHGLDLRPPGMTPEGAWNPRYVQHLRTFTGPLRLMDWQRINDWGNTGRWAARNVSFTNSVPAGSRIGLLAAIANVAARDPWVQVPPKADDEFVIELARAVDGCLAADRTIWLEYGNEAWNYPSNPTAAYCREQGVTLDSDPAVGSRKFYGRRSNQVFRLFASTVRPGRRLVRVIAGMAAITQVAADAIAQLEADHGKFDALAIAPYFWNLDYPDDKILADLNAGKPKPQILSDVLASCGRCVDGWAADRVRDHKILADRYGVPLVAYECGQHLVPMPPNQNGPLASLYIGCNADPRMAGLYTRYYGVLAAGGMTTACHLSLAGSYTKYGSWGLKRRLDQPDGEAPKWTATAEAIRTHAPPTRSAAEELRGRIGRIRSELDGLDAGLKGMLEASPAREAAP